MPKQSKLDLLDCTPEQISQVRTDRHLAPIHFCIPLMPEKDFNAGLRSASLNFQTYKMPKPTWDHDHCEFCWAKFMEPDNEGTLNGGYYCESEDTHSCEQMPFQKHNPWLTLREKKMNFSSMRRLNSLSFSDVSVLFFVLAVALSVQSFGAESQSPRDINQRTVFNPVTTSSPRTLEPWRVAFQRSPGANINTAILANSLSVGVLPRLELGTAPVFYLSPQHRYNYNLKLNFWKGDWIDWGLAYSETRFRLNLDGYYGNESPDLIMSTGSLLVNLHPEALPFQVVVFGSNSCGYIDSNDALVFINSFKCVSEAGFDIQVPFKEKYWLTVGNASLREAGLSPYEGLSTGWGAAVSTFRPGELFSRPSLGFYYIPSTGQTLALVSTTFYEK